MTLVQVPRGADSPRLTFQSLPACRPAALISLYNVLLSVSPGRLFFLNPVVTLLESLLYNYLFFLLIAWPTYVHVIIIIILNFYYRGNY